MSDDKQYRDEIFTGEGQWTQEPIVVATVIPEPAAAPPPPAPVIRRRIWLPIFLFIATCLSTFAVGSVLVMVGGEIVLLPLTWPRFLLGLEYAACVMTILICHEAGHFIQAWRYRVYASLPYFIPMPLSPIGTFGAVIGMDSRVGDRKALFDIGITGPLAGLVPTLVFCILGMLNATHSFVPQGALGVNRFGDPLLLRLLIHLRFPSLPEGHDVILNPMLFAGWVGLLITSLNLMPIGQLDGGHILYGLLRRRAHVVATLLLLGAILAVVLSKNFGWSLMLFLLVMMGPNHPPTANDNVPLGPWRIMLGWLTLAFILIGFTPTPIVL